MDQGLGPERLRRLAEGTVGPGGQRQCGQGTVKADGDHCEIFCFKLFLGKLGMAQWCIGSLPLLFLLPPLSLPSGEEGLPGPCNAAWLQ